MDDVTQFVIRHSSLVLFAAVFAEQVGLPIPAVPVLLAAGALAGAGQMNLGMAVGLAVAACLVGDFIWYYLGRYRGRHVLNLLCRISLEPDSCIRRTETFFGRHGMWSLVLSNFIPGLSTVTPALAGLFGVSVERFLLYNGLGALLWTVTYIAPGYLFSDQLEQIAAQAARFGGSLVVLIVGDRKSTRLNSSHLVISYAVFCLKKKIDSIPRPIENIAHLRSHHRKRQKPEVVSSVIWFAQIGQLAD